MTVNGMIYIGNGGQGKMMFKTGMILRTHVWILNKTAFETSNLTKE
jgi:hypothetical protein